MSKRPNVFGEAALAAYKKRQARTGVVGCFRPGSPLIEAAKADPESAVMDLDWLERTLESIPMKKLESLREMFRVFEDHPRGNTAVFKVLMLYQFLKDAESRGHLARLQKPVTGPAPRRMTDAEVARAREALKQYAVPADFKPWDFSED